MNRRKFFTTVGGLAIVAGPAWSADHILNQRAIETTGGSQAKRQVFLDTETTGCWPEDGHRIVEIGAVEVINGEITGRRFHTYLDPGRDVDAGAQEVHGLDREFLTGRPSFENVWNDLQHFIMGVELLVHNAPFDIDFLNFELAGINALSIEQYCLNITDTLAMARTLHKGMRNDLDTLCMRYGVVFSEENIGSTIRSAEHLAMVLLPNDFLTIFDLQPTNTKVATRHILKMVDEHRIDDRATNGAYDGNELGSRFFRDVDGVTLCD
jgi:DNA polymerase-3 subunit epsilon